MALLTISLPAAEAAPSPADFEALRSQFEALAQAVSGALSNIALRETLERLALTDELTELPNRRAFLQEVGRELARLRRTGQPHALCLLDIDHFKSVNDTLGHDAGDELLRRVALLMRRHLREADLCARVGGEEFAIFLADISPETTEQRVQSLLNTLRAGCFIGDGWSRPRLAWRIPPTWAPMRASRRCTGLRTGPCTPQNSWGGTAWCATARPR
ncbi:MAG: GGDEF domain-containing protein, partial [Planctomycetota bacterium]